MRDGPDGFPTKSSIADAGFFGRQTARSRSDRGNMNKVSLTIGMSFPKPAPGSFWDGLVTHNDHMPKAHEERREERNSKAAKSGREKRALKKATNLRAKHRAKLAGFRPDDPDWAEAVAGFELEITREAKRKLAGPAPFHGVEGPRRPSPVELRGPVTRGTSGPSPASARKAPKPFTNDGLTPAQRRTAVETFVTTDGAVLVIRQRKPFQKRTAELEGAVKPREVTGIHPSPVPVGWDRRAKAVDPFIP